MIYKLRYLTNLLIGMLLAVFSVALSSCNDDVFSTNPAHQLSFSTDTLSFDTVFTSLGSATSKIMVYNRNNVALNISNIRIGKADASFFHINVDGSLSEKNQFDDVEIRANDSLFVFVSINIDPTNDKMPLIVTDMISFETNGVVQTVHLEAIGKNVKRLYNVEIKSDSALNDTLPYLVYGNLVVDSAKTLTLNAGCKLYFHNNANLVVYGNLKAKGTLLKPILMRGDRLDNLKFATPFPYNNVAGQWGGIYLLWSGGKHSLEYVDMNSGYVGVYLLNNDRANLPSMTVSNCRIHNFLLYGLVAQNANITVSNTEISNSSSYSVFLNGGLHEFIHCTIANFFNNSTVQPASRDKKPAVMIMNLNRVAPMESRFYNCIISGSADNEFSLATRFEAQYQGTFKNNYIRKSEALNLPQFSSSKWSSKNDTVFKSVRYDYEKNTYFNFELDSVSSARGIADKTMSRRYRFDINGNNRMADGAPDAGAYEWKSSKE